MASPDLVIGHHKLATEFFIGHVRHTTFRSDVRQGRRRVKEVKNWYSDREIGRGSFGTVFLERSERGEYRAVKQIAKDKNSTIKVDYRRELMAMAILAKHDALFVQLLGWYESDDYVHIAMEYISNGHLRNYLEVERSESEAKVVTRQLLEGLVVIHQEGFAHRDLKPENILVVSTSPLWVKIGDFGLAKLARDGTAFRTQAFSAGYSAPEMGVKTSGDSSEYTDAVDIWAIGCIAHEMLTRVLPFPTIYELSLYCTHPDFPRNPMLLKNISWEGMEIVESMLALPPERRITAQEALHSEWLRLEDEGREWWETEEDSAGPALPEVPAPSGAEVVNGDSLPSNDKEGFCSRVATTVDVKDRRTAEVLLLDPAQRLQVGFLSKGLIGEEMLEMAKNFDTLESPCHIDEVAVRAGEDAAQLRDCYPNFIELGPTKPSSLESSLPLLIPPPSPNMLSTMTGASPDTSSVLSSSPCFPTPSVSGTASDTIYVRRSSSSVVPPPPSAAEQQPSSSTGPPTATLTGRIVKPAKRWGDWGQMALVGVGDTDMPPVKEALSGPEAGEWRDAMKREVDSIMEYGTWEESEAPAGARFVDTKWVLKKKRDETGSLVKNEARLTARGSTQTLGIDFDETFATVVRSDTVRLLLAHVVQHGYYTAQYDIERAYLNVPLEEEIYIQPPVGVVARAGSVLRLRKSIYGLKQTARCWSDTLCLALKERGFHRSAADPALFIHHSEAEYVAIYVDDLLHISKEPTDFGTWLASRYNVKNLGRPRSLLSVQLDWAADGSRLELCQTQYLRKIVQKYLPSGARPMSTPMSPSERPMKRATDEPRADLKEYQSTIGSLYAAITTRPDIMFSVCCLSNFLMDPSQEHLRMAKNILRYLAGTLERKLIYRRQKTPVLRPLSVYSGASFANSLSDRKSFSGSIAFYLGCPVAWTCAKQPVVALSTTEAEYISLTNAIQSLTWIQQLLADLRCQPANKPTLLGDSVSSHHLTRNASLHCRSKHIDVRYHYIREQYESGKFELELVSGKENPAGLFTKALQGEHRAYLVSLLFN